jgi:hypothetical protein
MTSRFRKLATVLVLIPTWLSAAGGSSRAQDSGQDDELSLADLTAYRAALSGKATADDARPTDPSARVGFRDLWDRPDAHRGRRVTVEGRVGRIFRQGPVGSFPPLIQVWAYSPAGDPFCLVFPRPADSAAPVKESESRAAIPGLGQTVQFTGTFLKIVRYAAGDGPRLAPLVVGDRPPAPAVRGKGVSASPASGEPGSPARILRAIGGERAGPASSAWSPASWGLALALAAVAVGILAWQHLRGAQLRSRAVIRNRHFDPQSGESPVSFRDSTQDSRV